MCSAVLPPSRDEDPTGLVSGISDLYLIDMLLSLVVQNLVDVTAQILTPTVASWKVI